LSHPAAILQRTEPLQQRVAEVSYSCPKLKTTLRTKNNNNRKNKQKRKKAQLKHLKHQLINSCKRRANCVPKSTLTYFLGVCIQTTSGKQPVLQNGFRELQFPFFIFLIHSGTKNF